VSSRPEMAVMKARLDMGPISPQRGRGSRKPPSIPLDEALPAGCLQVGAQLDCLLLGGEGTGEGTVECSLFGDIDLFHDRSAAAVGGLTAAGAALPGAPASGVSPFTDSVLILRGSWFGSVPLPALAGGGAVVDTLAAGGGLLFWFSGGNTTRGPERALTSTGV